MFGTAYLPARKASGYGLWDEAPFPEGFVRQQLWAFRRFEQPGPKPKRD